MSSVATTNIPMNPGSLTIQTMGGSPTGAQTYQMPQTVTSPGGAQTLMSQTMTMPPSPMGAQATTSFGTPQMRPQTQPLTISQPGMTASTGSLRAPLTPSGRVSSGSLVSTGTLT